MRLEFRISLYFKVIWGTARPASLLAGLFFMTFAQAYAQTLEAEGGYSNHASDTGRETWRGISRRWWPSWKGWPFIDEYRSKDRLDLASTNEQLERYTAEFYQAHFWDAVRGDEVSRYSPEIACELFDAAVNHDPHDAARFLQEALNALNRGGKMFPDLEVDGALGALTLNAIGKIKDLPSLWWWMKISRGAHYMSIMRRNKSQEDFARGWAHRQMDGLVSCPVARK